MVKGERMNELGSNFIRNYPVQPLQAFETLVRVNRILYEIILILDLLYVFYLTLSTQTHF